MSKAKEIGLQIREAAEVDSNILLICHFDADGLAAGSIMGSALLRWGASVHIKTVKQLDEDTLKKFKAIKSDIIVFSEIGSGYLGIVEEYLDGRLFVLDHHPPALLSGDRLNHLNPMEFGFDGVNEVGGAGVNYFAAKEADARNIDLAHLAVIGALGDMQDRNEHRELIGLNRLIVEDAVESGYLKVEKDLVFFGRETRPIFKALASTTSPFLPGLTGREDVCLALLSSAGIPYKDGERWRTIANLNMDEKRRLISKIVKYLTSKGFKAELTHELIGSVYTLIREEEGSILRDAREYSSTLNACGRTDKPGLGLSLCLGEEGLVMKEIEELVRDYKQMLAKHMEWIAQNPDKIHRLNALYVVRGEDFVDERLVGAVASMFSTSNLTGKDRPLIVTSKPKDGLIKISARANREQVEGNINLGELLSAISEKFSGLGGGHDVAAGAQVPEGKIEEYLRELDRETMDRCSN